MSFTTTALLVIALIGLAVTQTYAFNVMPLQGTTIPAASNLKSSHVNLKGNFRMSTIDYFPGQLPPTGIFDPLNLSADKSERELKRWRESELKHGRIAMLAAVGILVQEKFHPLFGGQISGPAINHFQQVQAIFPPFWYLILLGCGIVEGASILKGWETPYEAQKVSSTGAAMLKKDYVPGDLGFDPLNLHFLTTGQNVATNWNSLSPEFVDKRNKELQNGRLAMLAVAGFVAQELIDGRTIAQHCAEFGLGRSS